MSPPTEQLIRDYLNRLSVAARDRLGPDDRRALVERTRKLIERKADFAGRPTTLEVGKVLTRLGDPAVLVEQEWRRLAAVRGELPADPPAPAAVPQPADSDESWELAEAAEPGSSRSFLAWALRRERGRGWRGNSGWPTAAPSENGTSHDGDGAATTSEPKRRLPSIVTRHDDTAAYPQSVLPALDGTIVGAAMTSADTAEAAGVAAAPANGTNGVSRTAAFEAGTTDEPEAPAESGRGGDAVRLLRTLASAGWQQPLEATAVILLGVGGAIFPPVFLLGAAVALGSKLWHYRDKWAGLVLPPVLTIIGVAAGIAFGGRSHGLHDAWVSLNVVSRVAALMGAAYLAWRMGPGRRPPPAPPWHKPHRVT